MYICLRTNKGEHANFLWIFFFNFFSPIFFSFPPQLSKVAIVSFHSMFVKYATNVPMVPNIKYYWKEHVREFRYVNAVLFVSMLCTILPAWLIDRLSFLDVLSFCLCLFIYIPVRIRVRIGPPHPLVCRKRRLNGAVLRMRPEKPRSRATAGVVR